MVEILGYRIPLETEDQIRIIDLDNPADKRKDEFAGLEHSDEMTNFREVNKNLMNRDVNKNLMDREEITDFDVPRDPRNTVNLKKQLNDLKDNLADTNEEIRFEAIRIEFDLNLSVAIK
ncbi:hypothetical protein TcasGA2_TC016177 [Tribolium castaneum]|uniref:Uncharacterized protein n=1 Tax=Tribolium castaneum TaxID=7070 RepID=D7EJ01_TRICA|nr:hypothetical protein TcasGA2_TC016177 [Tribolium castaneum]